MSPSLDLSSIGNTYLDTLKLGIIVAGLDVEKWKDYRKLQHILLRHELTK